MCLFVGVSKKERDREHETEKERDRERQRETERKRETEGERQRLQPTQVLFGSCPNSCVSHKLRVGGVVGWEG